MLRVTVEGEIERARAGGMDLCRGCRWEGGKHTLVEGSRVGGRECMSE